MLNPKTSSPRTRARFMARISPSDQTITHLPRRLYRSRRCAGLEDGLPRTGGVEQFQAIADRPPSVHVLERLAKRPFGVARVGARHPGRDHLAERHGLAIAFVAARD